MAPPTSPPPLPEILRIHKAEITGLPIDSHGGSYDQDRWQKRFPNDQAVQDIIDSHPGQLSRTDLTNIGDRARRGDTRAQRELFFGVMMWGYGPGGGRSYGNAKEAVGSEKFEARLSDAAKCVARCDLRAAYRSLSSPKNAKGFNEPFFTKYLYFLARGDREWSQDSPKPLILDRKVVESLRFIHDVFDNGLDELVAVTPSVARYNYYCIALANWAMRIGCDADQIERFLFKQSFRFNTGKAFRKLAPAVVLALDGDVEANALYDRVKCAAGHVPPDLIHSIRKPIAGVN